MKFEVVAIDECGTEIVVADFLSLDRAREIASCVIEEYPEYRQVRVNSSVVYDAINDPWDEY